MTGRVGEDAEPLAAAGQSGRTDRENPLLGRVEVVDPHVEVHLLRRVPVRPARRQVIGVRWKATPGRSGASPMTTKWSSSCTRIMPSSSW